MKLLDDMHRIESLLSAISDGLASEWSQDYVTAFSWSSRYNKLGAALVHLYDKPNAGNAQLTAFLLAGILERDNVCKNRESWDVAKDAIDFIYDPNCPFCTGRGILNLEQDTCPWCHGTGQRERPSYKPVLDAVGIMADSLHWLNAQLSKRLAGSPDKPADRRYVLRLDGNERIEHIPADGNRTIPKPAAS